MILGIGNDLIDTRRVEKTIERFGQRFIMRVFTEVEQKRCDRRAGRAACYARRFAAKEAMSKALGTGLRQGVYWRDMRVMNRPGGKPTFELAGQALAHLHRMVPDGMEPRIHLTITDDPPLAQAIVIIEAVERR